MYIKNKFRTQSFTLIEIVIVALIIGFIATGANVVYSNLVEQSQEAVVDHNASTVANMINAQLTLTGRLPNFAETLAHARFDSSIQATNDIRGFKLVGGAGAVNQYNNIITSNGILRRDAFYGDVVAGDGSSIDNNTDFFYFNNLNVPQSMLLVEMGVSHVLLLDHKVMDDQPSDLKDAINNSVSFNDALWNSYDPSKIHLSPSIINTDSVQYGFAANIDKNNNVGAVNDRLKVCLHATDLMKAKFNLPLQNSVIALGIGPATTFSDDISINEFDVDIDVSKVPTRPDLPKGLYNNYMMLIDVTSSPAKFIGITDILGTRY